MFSFEVFYMWRASVAPSIKNKKYDFVHIFRCENIEKKINPH